MRRRDALRLVTCAATAACTRALRAQPGRVPAAGILRVGPQSGSLEKIFADAFKSYMRALGWEPDRNVRYVSRWAEGHIERLPALAADLVRENVDILITFGNAAIAAVQRATATIPIVGMTDDMVASGLVASLARPGSNTTGVSILAPDLDAKRLELLHEFVPHAKRIGILSDPTTTSTRQPVDNVAAALGIKPMWYEAKSNDQMRVALDEMMAARVEAVNILASPVLNQARELVIARVREARVPAIYQWPETAEEGGLLAYGPRLLLCYRHVCALVDKVLRGAQPATLPVEQPNKFDLVLNLKTAQELGLTFSPQLLLRADALVE